MDAFFGRKGLVAAFLILTWHLAFALAYPAPGLDKKKSSRPGEAQIKGVVRRVPLDPKQFDGHTRTWIEETWTITTQVRGEKIEWRVVMDRQWLDMARANVGKTVIATGRAAVGVFPAEANRPEELQTEHWFVALVAEHCKGPLHTYSVLDRMNVGGGGIGRMPTYGQPISRAQCSFRVATLKAVDK